MRGFAGFWGGEGGKTLVFERYTGNAVHPEPVGEGSWEYARSPHWRSLKRSPPRPDRGADLSLPCAKAKVHCACSHDSLPHALCSLWAALSHQKCKRIRSSPPFAECSLADLCAHLDPLPDTHHMNHLYGATACHEQWRLLPVSFGGFSSHAGNQGGGYR